MGRHRRRARRETPMLAWLQRARSAASGGQSMKRRKQCTCAWRIPVSSPGGLRVKRAMHNRCPGASTLFDWLCRWRSITTQVNEEATDLQFLTHHDLSLRQRDEPRRQHQESGFDQKLGPTWFPAPPRRNCHQGEGNDGIPRPGKRQSWRPMTRIRKPLVDELEKCPMAMRCGPTPVLLIVWQPTAPIDPPTQRRDIGVMHELKRECIGYQFLSQVQGLTRGEMASTPRPGHNGKGRDQTDRHPGQLDGQEHPQRPGSA